MESGAKGGGGKESERARADGRRAAGFIIEGEGVCFYVSVCEREKVVVTRARALGLKRITLPLLLGSLGRAGLEKVEEEGKRRKKNKLYYSRVFSPEAAAKLI